ncbi:flavin reductase family protein [Enterococcus nangangensis]|uniref:flavin reductase family protein n=1 Tax=Enterococcus nangangensis TaxID=2559926 RepID=UPI0010F588FE|nr:flavin reductase family protein [Enterococcus nangangensis]
MHHYAATTLTPQQQYKFITSIVVPRPIAWLTTYNQDHTVLNLAPFSFYSGVSNQLPLVTVAILRDSSEPKDTARNLLATKEAVLHLVDQTKLARMNETAAKIAPNQSEVALAGLQTVPSKTVAVPSLADVLVKMEARVYQYLPLKNPNGAVMTDLFILEICDFYFAEEIFDAKREYLDFLKVQPVARLAGPYYGTIQEQIYLPRPS